MNLSIFFVPILLPIIFGFLCLIIPKKLKGIREPLALIGVLSTFILTILFFLKRKTLSGLPWFYLDSLSSFILLAIGLFGVLITLYSLKFMKGKDRLNEYYTYLLWTIGASCGVVLVNNLILLLVFWGFLGLTLYLLIGIGGPKAVDSAKKTLIIVGGSDALMVLGVAALWVLTQSFQMDKINIAIAGGLPILAFSTLAIAAFTKAGAMPFHTWIPDMAENAPVPVTAFLPAALDKLLGIYLLARIAMNLFIMSKGAGLVLMAIGAGTIIFAVMMALIQHDAKRLLGYHAVSQVGYMLLGIGTGNPIGIAGGLFHMLNNAIYKGCLFLGVGAVEHKTGTTDLGKLGGLAKAMPVTFVTCLIAALSISGVPPFNGFFSKWMVYQGVIELGKQDSKLWIIWLVAAMFGSALTLASFMKLIHAIFLGRSSEQPSQISAKKEVSFTMWFPMVVLAGLCIIFGVFAYQVPLGLFILPSVAKVLFLGFWSPSFATLLIIIGIILGLIIYSLGKVRLVRESSPFIGGEVLTQEMRVSGERFYQTIEDIGLLNKVYRMAKNKCFDIYEQGKKIVFFFTKKLQYLHNGVLPTYLVWCLLGMIVLFLTLMR